MKCPECIEELAVEVCDPSPGAQGFYWVCPVCNYSSVCMTEKEFEESEVYRPGTEGEKRTTRAPANEQLKTDIERFVVHQMLKVVRALRGAHSMLWMGKNDKVKIVLSDARDQIKDIINLIPDEEKKEAGNRLQEQDQVHG